MIPDELRPEAIGDPADLCNPLPPKVVPAARLAKHQAIRPQTERLRHQDYEVEFAVCFVTRLGLNSDARDKHTFLERATRVDEAPKSYNHRHAALQLRV